MTKLALRIGVNKFWNHLYYQGLYFWDHRNPIPLFHYFKQDLYIKRVIQGFYPFSKIEIHKTRGNYDVYVSKDKLTAKAGLALAVGAVSFNKQTALHRVLFNVLKARIQIFHLYTFPIHDANLLVSYLARPGNPGARPPFKQKSRLKAFNRLWKMGVIKGVKIKIKGRYKKSTRTKNEVYQFGLSPNSPTTNLKTKLFYSSHILIQPLGVSSLHIYIVY